MHHVDWTQFLAPIYSRNDDHAGHEQYQFASCGVRVKWHCCWMKVIFVKRARSEILIQSLPLQSHSCKWIPWHFFGHLRRRSIVASPVNVSKKAVSDVR